jgi:hypothetical protein
MQHTLHDYATGLDFPVTYRDITNRDGATIAVANVDLEGYMPPDHEAWVPIVVAADGTVMVSADWQSSMPPVDWEIQDYRWVRASDGAPCVLFNGLPVPLAG